MHNLLCIHMQSYQNRHTYMHGNAYIIQTHTKYNHYSSYPTVTTRCLPQKHTLANLNLQFQWQQAKQSELPPQLFQGWMLFMTHFCCEEPGSQGTRWSLLSEPDSTHFLYFMCLICPSACNIAKHLISSEQMHQ